jgi:hypothetical protein
MTVSTSDIEEFARLLVREVRDVAVRSCDAQLRPGSAAPVARRWSAALANASPDELARTIVPDCVDEVLFCLLRAVDQGVLRLSYATSQGNLVDLAEDGLGELAGWYMGSGGWRAMFSGQRFVDDFGDIGGT